MRGKTGLTISVATLAQVAAIHGAQAQDSASATGNGAVIPEVVVTGTTAKHRTKLESSVAITTVEAAKLEKLAPHSLADSLQQVPGLWVEASGGEVSNNVSPRGLSGGAAFQFISLQEDGLPVIYDGELVDVLLREDVTIKRFEAIRGGTSAILSTNGPAAIVNFISHKGSQTPQGEVKVTVSDYNMVRTEGVYSGPINEDWTYSAGGYYRRGKGVRPIGITADHGGQFRLNLSRRLAGGELNLSAKYVNDHNTFYLPIPLTNPAKPTGVPGVDPHYGSLDGPDVAHISNTTTNGTINTNLDTGFHVLAKVLGADLQHELGGDWSFRNNARYTRYDVAPHSVFNGPNSYLVRAGNRLDPEQSSDVAALLARFGGTAKFAYAGTGQVIADPSTLNGNGFTTDAVAETRFRSLGHFVDKLSLTKENDSNSFTAGVLFASQKLHEDSDYGARIITEVRDQPRRLDIVAVDANNKILGYLSDKGVLRNGYFYERHKGDMNSTSLFVNDEWKVNRKLRLDAGVRYEIARYDVQDENVLAAGDDLPGNSLTEGAIIPGAFNPDGSDKDNIIANNYMRRAGTGEWTRKKKTIKETSYTAGFNYAFNDHVAAYGRYASGTNMPTLYSADSFVDGASRLSFAEAGVRYISPFWTTSATLFHTKFDNLSFGETNQATGDFRQVFVKTLSTGVELEGVVNLYKRFSLEYVATIQDATINGIDPNAEEAKQNGNQVMRTPNTQVRLIPTVHFDFGDLFLVYTRIGKRYADFENALELPAYHVLDLGAEFRIDKHWKLNFKVNNVTNEIGLTEGNPRSGFNQSSNGSLFYARPILGRNATLSLSYRF
ncbi:TonB-dependent siderophore receptor [Pseudoduganella violaceinigra]|uniref:TonB-dependent siderophore receptor n=1 Tax=Pseudoduganella violaceinigra TaxID=246602 RepID=UPI0004023E51|nr:TonB-dependent receptor [Pseudoduganella violaceinigra]